MSSPIIERPAPTLATTPTPTLATTPSTTLAPSTPVGALKRRTIDSVLIGFGLVAVVVFAVSGALLTWGNNFSADYVHDELSSQNITFPSAEALTDEGRTDLLKYAGHDLDTGKEAEAYASYINGHLEGIADGATFADLGTPERAPKGAVIAAALPPSVRSSLPPSWPSWWPSEWSVTASSPRPPDPPTERTADARSERVGICARSGIRVFGSFGRWWPDRCRQPWQGRRQ